MQSFLDLERRDFNSMLKQSINSFLEAKKNNKAKCENCGNSSKFVMKDDCLVCKNCNMEIKLKEETACV